MIAPDNTVKKHTSMYVGKHSWRPIVICGVLLLGCVGILAIVFLHNAPKTIDQEDEMLKANLINEVTVRQRAPKIQEQPQITIDPNARPTKVGEEVNGYVMLPSGRVHRRVGIVTNTMDSALFKLPYEVFDYSCENEIACLLELKAGEGLIGTPSYNGRFKDEFLESLKTAIVINSDDSDYIKSVKQQVIEAKKDLKAAMDRGEDVEEIMLNTRKELQTLSVYRMQLEEELEAIIHKDGTTEDDIDDCLKAINIMLEEKGIATLNLGPIAKRKLRNIIKQKEE